MNKESLFWVVLSVEIPTRIGGDHARRHEPCGFLPVFSTEEAARSYAGDRYLISVARMREVEQEGVAAEHT